MDRSRAMGRRHQISSPKGLVLAQFTTAGLTGAAVMTWVALSPSLIPRTWWMTAFNVGLCATYGYGLGLLLAALLRMAARRVGLVVRARERSVLWLRRLWHLALVGGTIFAWWQSVHSQARIAQRLGVPATQLWDQSLGLLGGVALFGVLMLLARVLRLLGRAVGRLLRPFTPSIVASSASIVIVALLVGFVSNDVLYANFVESATEQAVKVNAETPPGRRPPLLATRSGGPGSPETWASLGRQGQGVVADGPTKRRIEQVTGQPAKDPIRVYAGKRDDRSLEATADAVVAELHRTRALDRKVLVVIVPAGEGWIPEWHPSAVEFLAGGDSAIASMQYTYLPSALAFYTDLETARKAGRVLFDRVAAVVEQRPAHQRPQLFIAGESLGAYGGQAAFADSADLLRRVDGAVWTGTPRLSPMWQELTAQRRDGTPEIAPVVDDGRHIRFFIRPENLINDFYGRSLGTWHRPRVVLAQYPTDPIVWWSWDLMWSEPDWVRERASPKAAQMRWAPWATFWQIMSDMPRSVRVPGGEGHRYQEDLVPMWAGVLGMDPMADYGPIQRAMRADYRVY